MPLPSLPTPVGTNFIKDWPSQNSVICDAVDTYAGPCLTTQPLFTYTPVLSATGTQPVIGAGVIRGYYYKIFDQIYVFGEFRFGAGFSVGTGSFIVSLPFTVNTTVGANVQLARAPVIGSGMCWDASLDAGRQPITVHLRTPDTMMFGIRTASGAAFREVNAANAPITWATGDGLTWIARYQRVA